MISGLHFKYIGNPHQTLLLKKSRYDFADILASRLSSYKDRYAKNLFAFSIEDFISEHVAVVDDKTGDVLGSFKYVNTNTCQCFNLDLPIINTLRSRKSRVFLRAVKHYVDQQIAMGSNLGYIRGLNVSARLRDNPKRKKLVKNMLSAGIVLCSDEAQTDSILVTGTIPNGSYLYIQWLGFDILYPQPVIVESVGRTTAYIMEQKRWSESAWRNAESFSSLWEAREKGGFDLPGEEESLAS